jgi:hypothetical protein
MFTDRGHLWKSVISIALLIVLGWFHADFSMQRPQGYRAFVKAPDQHDGAPVLLPIWEVTHIRDASMYSVSKTVLGVPIQGSSEGLSVGDTVTIMGHFRASDQAVIAYERVDHPWRAAKGLLSILALLFGCWLAPRFFGFSGGRVVLRG